MSLAQMLLRQARLAPGRTAVFNGTQPWATYGEWAARSAGFAPKLSVVEITGTCSHCQKAGQKSKP